MVLPDKMGVKIRKFENLKINFALKVISSQRPLIKPLSNSLIIRPYSTVVCL